MEVWKWWLQMWGIMPSDELQRLRAENEILKAQMSVLSGKEQSKELFERIKRLNEEAYESWVRPLTGGRE